MPCDAAPCHAVPYIIHPEEKQKVVLQHAISLLPLRAEQCVLLVEQHALGRVLEDGRQLQRAIDGSVVALVSLLHSLLLAFAQALRTTQAPRPCALVKSAPRASRPCRSALACAVCGYRVNGWLKALSPSRVIRVRYLEEQLVLLHDGSPFGLHLEGAGVGLSHSRQQQFCPI